MRKNIGKNGATQTEGRIFLFALSRLKWKIKKKERRKRSDIKQKLVTFYFFLLTH